MTAIIIIIGVTDWNTITCSVMLKNTHMKTHTHTHTHTCTHTHTHTQKHTHINTHTHTQKHIHINTHTNIHTHTHRSTHTHTHTQTQTHTKAHIHYNLNKPNCSSAAAHHYENRPNQRKTLLHQGCSVPVLDFCCWAVDSMASNMAVKSSCFRRSLVLFVVTPIGRPSTTPCVSERMVCSSICLDLSKST